MPGVWYLLLLLAATPGCDDPSNRAESAALQLAINLERIGAGLQPLVADPVLCSMARERAQSVAASGSPDMDLPLLEQTRREVWRRGYRPHSWAQTSLILNPGDSLLVRWRELKPEAFDDSILGDFEHVGIGIAERDSGRPVYSVFVGLTHLTLEWRQVEPLRDIEAVRRQMLARVNEIRSARGRPTVAAEPRLDLAARRHAQDLLDNDYYSHRSLDGRNVRDRAIAAGFPRRPSVSENLAKGLFTPAEVVDRWMNSSGHRKNILNPRFTRMGCGIAFGETDRGVEVVWVQMFAGPG